jgi:hypothetical protein
MIERRSEMPKRRSVRAKELEINIAIPALRHIVYPTFLTN